MTSRLKLALLTMLVLLMPSLRERGPRLLQRAIAAAEMLRRWKQAEHWVYVIEGSELRLLPAQRRAHVDPDARVSSPAGKGDLRLALAGLFVQQKSVGPHPEARKKVARNLGVSRDRGFCRKGRNEVSDRDPTDNWHHLTIGGRS